MSRLAWRRVDVERTPAGSLKMNERTRLIRDLVRDSRYVVDEATIAEAMIMGAAARRLIAQLSSSQRAAAPAPR